MNRLNHSRLSLLAAAGCLSLLAGCASQSPSSSPEANPAAEAQVSQEFPTVARVEYVLQCMQEHGGQNYDNLYHCACAFDQLASRMNYQEYSESLTFTYMFDTPGEKGGEFRDPPKSKELREKLKAAKKAADTTCFPEKPKADDKAPQKKK